MTADRWVLVRWLLVIDALATGIVYGIGSRAEHQGLSFYYVNQFPGGMRAVGWLYLAVGALLAAGAHELEWRIAGHLLAVFAYLLYGIGLALAYTRGGDPGAGPVHMLLIAAMHAVLAVETARRKAK